MGAAFTITSMAAAPSESAEDVPAVTDRLLDQTPDAAWRGLPRWFPANHFVVIKLLQDAVGIVTTSGMISFLNAADCVAAQARACAARQRHPAFHG